MPLFTAGEAANCNLDTLICRWEDRCPRCEAHAYLTAEDWLLIRFYREVSDQWANEAPMGVEKGSAPLFFLRLEAMRAALDMDSVPRRLWPWYVNGARLLHRLIHRQEEIDWWSERGKPVSAISIEDVADD